MYSFLLSCCEHRPIIPGQIQSGIQRVCRGSHPLLVHVWRSALRGQDAPPESLGVLRDPNQQRQLLHTASRHIWTGTNAHTDASCLGSADALHSRRGGELPHGGDEAVLGLPGGANARRTVRLYRSQCGCHAAGRTEQPSGVTCCTSGHLRFHVEAVVRNPGLSRFLNFFFFFCTFCKNFQKHTWDECLHTFMFVFVDFRRFFCAYCVFPCWHCQIFTPEVWNWKALYFLP